MRGYLIVAVVRLMAKAVEPGPAHQTPAGSGASDGSVRERKN
jgi:hypothetical protein